MPESMKKHAEKGENCVTILSEFIAEKYLKSSILSPTVCHDTARNQIQIPYRFSPVPRTEISYKFFIKEFL